MSNIRYQIKVTLKGVRPPIWRRLLVPANCTMDALHSAIQTAMGWLDGHLYDFVIPKGRQIARLVQLPDPDEMWDPQWSRGPKPEDATRVRLCDFAKPGDKFRYDYDFGDGWEHDILVEKAEPTDDINARKAVCLAGRRACPPEDCGGPWGYAELLEILAKPESERDERERELADMFCGEWDPEAFDLEETNDCLAGWRPNQTSRIYQFTQE